MEMDMSWRVGVRYHSTSTHTPVWQELGTGGHGWRVVTLCMRYSSARDRYGSGGKGAGSGSGNVSYPEILCGVWLHVHRTGQDRIL